MGNSEWNKQKKKVQQEAGNHCMICNDYVSHMPGDYLECHEIYEIDVAKREFSLKGLICICMKCHEFIHHGRLARLVAERKITKSYYEQIMIRGNDLLANSGLKKQNLPPEEIRNPDWYLLYNGKKYSVSKGGE